MGLKNEEKKIKGEIILLISWKLFKIDEERLIFRMKPINDITKICNQIREIHPRNPLFLD